MGIGDWGLGIGDWAQSEKLTDELKEKWEAKIEKLLKEVREL